MSAAFILEELHSVADPMKAAFLQGFFKTGKGQYAEGDVFLGIRNPVVRDIVKTTGSLPLEEVQILLDSIYHEARLAGFLFLVRMFEKAKKEEERKRIFDFYLANARKANNWDLVDITCSKVIGAYLCDKADREILYRLSESENLWEQRMSIVSTVAFIRKKDFTDTFALAEKFLVHKHDLMHKATGWMLREIGKRDKSALIAFLDTYSKNMPRTALRYAIEHFSSEERAYYMKK